MTLTIPLPELLLGLSIGAPLGVFVGHYLVWPLIYRWFQ